MKCFSGSVFELCDFTFEDCDLSGCCIFFFMEFVCVDFVVWALKLSFCFIGFSVWMKASTSRRIICAFLNISIFLEEMFVSWL